MDYGNVNARIKGMKSRLLDQRDLEELTNNQDIDSLIAALEATDYRNELQKAGVEYSGITQVEMALRRDLIRAFRKILHLFHDEVEETYIRLILNRYDIQNIKTILRGKKINAHPDEIHENLVPAGELDFGALIELSRQPDIRAVIDLLATWRIDYALPLTRHLQEYLDTRDLATLESALDRYYFEHALSFFSNRDDYNQEIIRELIASEIDIVNIRTILRIVRDRMDPAEASVYLIEGGRYLRIEILINLIQGGTVDAVVKGLEETPYGFLTGVERDFIIYEKISALERELERYLITKGCKNFLKDPLSIAIPVGYIWAKQNEVTNIRIIARSIFGEVPEAEMRRAMTHV